MTETFDSTFSLSPFPGLRSFHRAEFDIFFGRDDHVSDMVDKLAQHQFLCITGPSGCGKSSLARTGLFNALEAGFLPGRGSDWIFCDLYPQTDPLERLCTSLATAIIMGESGRGAPEPGPDKTADIAELRNLFLNHIALHSSDLNPAVEKVTAVAGRPIAILVDQFEEIFRYAQDDPDAVSRFVDVLLKTASVQSDVYVIITIRTDQLEKCARYPGLTGAINQSQFLTPTLDRFQMQEAIEGPLSLFDGSITPELTIWMLNGLEEQLDKLPLMQHALRLLYDDARDKAPKGPITIGIDDFFRVFQIEQDPKRARSESHEALRTSLSHRLDTLYRRLDKPEQRLVRGLFCALTTMESQGRDIRRPLRLGEAIETLDCTLDDLVRVIGVFRDGADTYLRIVGIEDGIDEGDIVDVTHECILRLWKPLQETWLPREQRAAERIRFLARMARERERDFKGGLLDRVLGRGLLGGDTCKRYCAWWSEWRPNASWAGRYLEQIEWTESGAHVGPKEIFRRIESFRDISLKHANFEKFGLLGVVAVFVGVISYAGIQQVRSAHNQTRLAEQRATTAEALRRAADLDVQLLESEKARLLDEQRDDAWRAILAINPSRYEEKPIEVVGLASRALGRGIDVGLPEDGLQAAQQKLITAMSFVREYRRFDHRPRSDGAALMFLPDRQAQVYAAAFGPGDDRIVAITDGLQVALWNTARVDSPEQVIPLAPHVTYKDGVAGRALAVSADGTVAVGTQRGAVLLVEGVGEAGGAVQVHELYPGPDRWSYSSVFDVVFSEDGQTLIAGALSGQVHLWRRGADGTWADAGLFQSVDILGRARAGHAGPDVVDDLTVSERAVWSVDLGPGDDFAAMALGNGTICLFMLDATNATCRGDGHETGQVVKVVRFSPNGRELVSAGNDDRARIWTLFSDPAGTGLAGSLPTLILSPVVLWHDSDVWDLDFSPDGGLLVTASWDRTLSLFQAGTWKPLHKLRGHQQALRTVRFDESGRFILSASLDKTARLWTPFATRADEMDLTGRLPVERTDARLRSVALGAQGNWVASADETALWLKEAGRELRRVPLPAVSTSGDPSVTRVAAPASQDSLVAALADPVVVLGDRDPAGNWDIRAVRLNVDGFEDSLANRYITVSDDGERYAVNVKGAQGYVVLVCETGRDVCGIAPGTHVAAIDFVPEIAHGRAADDACNRPAFPTALALSSDGRKLSVGGSDCNVRLFDLDLPETEQRMSAAMTLHVGTIHALDFSPDDRRLVSGSADWTARVWTIESGLAVQLAEHRSNVNDVEFLPSGNGVATVSSDERLIVWNIETGDPSLEIPGFSATVEAVDIKLAGQDVKIASGTSRGDYLVQRFFEQPSAYIDFAETALQQVRLAED